MTGVAWPLPVARERAFDARLCLWPALALGLALRIGALAGAGIEHPDEIFQYLEQAHRWLTGAGVIPWEYRYGMRGGLLPLLLAGPMALGQWLAPDAALWAGPRLGLVLLSLVPVAAAWGIGRRCSAAHGAFAALAIALAPDLVHFAPHALAEPVAVALLLGGVALADDGGRRAVIAGGALLALCACIRFQYAPAALVLALGVAAEQRRRLIAGALAGAALSGVADLAFGIAPFGWMLVNLHENLIEGRAALYGVAAPAAYPLALAELWGGWAVALLPLAAIGARRRPALAAAALATLALHMLVGHKEYRFILLPSALATLLAGLGSADLLARAVLHRDRWTTIAAALWLVAAASIFASGRAAALTPPPAPGVAFFASLRGDAPACAVGLWRVHWSGTTGAVGLGRPLPILIVDDALSPARPATAFNRLIAPRSLKLSGFAERACDAAGACLYARAGGCTPAAGAVPINRWLQAHDQ